MKKNLDNCPKCGTKFEIDTENLKSEGCYILSGDIDALVECKKCLHMRKIKLFLPVVKRKPEITIKQRMNKVKEKFKRKKLSKQVGKIIEE